MSSSSGSACTQPREVWRLTNVLGKVVWEGKDHPSVRKLQEILDEDIRNGILSTVSTVALTSYAIQVVLHCPSKSLSIIMNALCCAFYRNEHGNIDTKKLLSLRMANKRALCGRPIKKGDILWVCKQCGQDNTCVQCDDCFQMSDHTDHEVYFHRSTEGGGCCDCGDTEAWLESGTCCNHGLDPNAKDVDPLSILPVEVVAGTTAVLKGALLVTLHSTVACVNGFNCPENNPHVKRCIAANKAQKCEELLIRLHNDDVHTYFEVTSALQDCGLPPSKARVLTELVDKEGSADICHTSNIRSVEKHWNCLGKAPLGLCVCILPAKQATVEGGLPTLLGVWLLQLASSNDGLMRLVCNSFMMSTAKLSQCLRGSIPKSPFTSNLEINVDLSHLFDPNNHSGISSMSPTSSLQLIPSCLPLRANIPEADNKRDITTNPLNFVLLPKDADGIASVQSVQFNTDEGSDSPQAVAVKNIDPFNFSEKEGVLFSPRIVFAVLIACSPYATKALKKCLNSLIICLQQDMVFKLGYSQLLVHLYPTLMSLFCHGIGTNSDSIFGTSVQVFTADSVVRMMSSDGMDARPFQKWDEIEMSPCKTSHCDMELNGEEKMKFENNNDDSVQGGGCNHEGYCSTANCQHACIAPTLVSALLTAVNYAGLTKKTLSHSNSGSSKLQFADKDTFLESFTIKNKRLWHLCRDIEYIVGCSDRSLDFIYGYNRASNVDVHNYDCKQVHGTALDCWLELCCLLHGINGYRRIPRSDHHVQHDDHKWQISISFVLDLESVSTSVLRNVYSVGQNSNSFRHGSRRDVVDKLARDTFRQLSKLESFLPLEDADGIATMLCDVKPHHSNLRLGSAQQMLGSVVIDHSETQKGEASSESGADELPSPSARSVFDIVVPVTAVWPILSTSDSGNCTKLIHCCRWESSFSVSKRGRVSMLIPVGRFLAKVFLYACESGMMPDRDPNHYLGVEDTSDNFWDSCGNSPACRTNSVKSEEQSPLPSRHASDDEQVTAQDIPFEYGMKYGFDEMYTAMSNATADMSATGSASISTVRKRLSNIRSTINNISDMVQKVNVIEQYGGMADNLEYNSKQDTVESAVTWNIKSVCLLCEYALRSLSFAAQVERGLWRRNGGAVANLIYNYSRPVLSRNFRDLDVSTLQLGVLWLGPEIILRNMVTIFDVFPNVFEGESVTGGKKEDKVKGGFFDSKKIYGMYQKKDGQKSKTSDCTLEKQDEGHEKHQRCKSTAKVESKKVPSDVNVGDRGAMMSEMLRLLCHIVNYLPCDLSTTLDGDELPACESKVDSFGVAKHSRNEGRGSCPREGLTLALDRLVLHMILSGQRSLSELNSAKHMVGKEGDVSDSMIEQSVRRVCGPVSGRILEGGRDSYRNQCTRKLTFDVNPSIAIALFDPEFPFLSSSSQHLAIENMKTIVSTQSYKYTGVYDFHAELDKMLVELSATPNLPVLSRSAMPFPHPFFLPVRENLLTSRCFLQILCSVAEYLVQSLERVGKKINARSKSKRDDIEPSVMGELASRVVHLCTIRLHSVPIFNVVDEKIKDCNESIDNLESRLLASIGTIYKASTTGQLNAFNAPCGLQWVLEQYWHCGGQRARRCLLQVGVEKASLGLHSSSLDESVSDKVEKLNYDGSSSSIDLSFTESAQEKLRREKDARKEAAQKRALDFINSQAESFKKSLMIETRSGGSADLQEEPKQDAKLPECILCRESSTDILGYFVHTQPSTVLSRSLQTPFPNPLYSTTHHVKFRSRESICHANNDVSVQYVNSVDDPRYVVVSTVAANGRTGLQLYSRRENAQEFELKLPREASTGNRHGDLRNVFLQPGQIVEVLRRVQHWVKLRVNITSSMSRNGGTIPSDEFITGWAEIFTHVTNYGSHSEDSDDGNKYETNLVPLKEMEFSRHGLTRPFISTCGHAIHAKCWDTYMASALSSHINSRLFVGHNPTNPEIGEVLCPMCKSIANSFLPISCGEFERDIPEPSVYCAVSGSTSGIAEWKSSVPLHHSCSERTQLKADTSLYLAPVNCRMRYLAESVLSHSQLEAKSPYDGGYLDNDMIFTERDKCGYKSGTFHLEKFKGESNQKSIVQVMSRCVSRMRQLHALWSAISYSILLSTLLERGQGEVSQQVDASTEGEVSKSLQQHLLQCALSVEDWGFDKNDELGSTFEECVTYPLESLLLLRPSDDLYEGDAEHNVEKSSVAQSLIVQLARQPLPVVFDSKCPEDSRNIHNILRGLSDIVTNECEGKEQMRCDNVNSSEKSIVLKNIKVSGLWPILHQPLLTQDLYMLTVAALCSRSRSLYNNESELLDSASSLSSLVCLGRLIQILVEPMHIGEDDQHVNNSGKKRQYAFISSEDEIDAKNQEVSGLNELRRFACEQIGISAEDILQQEEVDGYDDILFAITKNKWLPFLEYMVEALNTFHVATMGKDGLTPEIQRSETSAYRLAHLLSIVGLEGLVNSDSQALDFSGGLLRELAKGWGHHYVNYYSYSPLLDKSMSEFVLSKSDMFCVLKAADWDDDSGSEDCDIPEWGSDESDSDDDDEIGKEETFDVVDEDVMIIEDLIDVDGVVYHRGGAEGSISELVDDVGNLTDIDGNNVNIMEGSIDENLLESLGNEDYSAHGDHRHSSDNEHDIPPQEDSDEEGGVGVREEISQWLREVGGALSTGGIDFSVLQERLRALPGFEEMSARQMQAMRDAFMEGRAQAIARLGGDEDIDQTQLNVNEDTEENEAIDSTDLKVRPWPLHGVLPHHNPYVVPHKRGKGNESLLESLLQSKSGCLPYWIGSLTGNVCCSVGISCDDMIVDSFLPNFAILDKSHWGGLVSGKANWKQLLIELPKMFTTLYKQVKVPPFNRCPAVAIDEPALCLVCGQVLSAGNRLSSTNAGRGGGRSPGECTIHAKSCGGGTGLFYLVERCSVLLVHNAQACYWGTLYLDKNGDAPSGGSIAGQNRPLYLSQDRYKQLQQFYAEHKIVREIIRLRSSEERYLRLNWY